MKIPLPYMGYWQRKLINKKVAITPLPSDYYEKNKVELYLRNQENDANRPNISARKELAQLISEIEKDKNLKLAIPLKLTYPVQQIVEAQKRFHYINKSYSRSNENRIVPVINIKVTTKTINRALRFMDTFIKLIRTRGHDIQFSDKSSYVIIDGENVDIRLSEKLQLIKKDYYGEYIPSGELKFVIGNNPEKTFDDKKLPIEQQLAVILAKMELMARQLKKERLAREERQKLYEEEQNRIREVKARKEKEIQDVKNLIKSVNHWHQSNLIRRFIDKFDSYTTQNGLQNDELTSWFLWAREKADWLDPFIKDEDNILKDEDKKHF